MAAADVSSSAAITDFGFDGYKTSRDVTWYKELTSLPWPARELLEKYSGYPASEVYKEVKALRNKAWETFPFPCIGTFDFLDLALSSRSTVYHRLLTRLQSQPQDTTFLDVGCCLGHDIRKLIFDGAPAENLVGAELRQGYIDLGYELFRDKDTLKSKFYQANVLDDIATGAWPALVGRFDVVNFSLVLHCFEREGQVAMLARGIAALKPGKLGTTIMGTACGAVEATELEWDGKVPVHSPESFRELVAEVEERTGTKWEVDVALDNFYNPDDERFNWIGAKMKRLVFELTRVA